MTRGHDDNRRIRAYNDLINAGVEINDDVDGRDQDLRRDKNDD